MNRLAIFKGIAHALQCGDHDTAENLTRDDGCTNMPSMNVYLESGAMRTLVGKVVNDDGCFRTTGWRFVPKERMADDG